MTDETAETPTPLAVCGRCRQAYNAHVPTPHNRACREFRPLTVDDLTLEERARIIRERQTP